MGDERTLEGREPDLHRWHQEAPMMGDILRRGTLMTVTATGGGKSSGYVCDHDGLGLLLDLRGDPDGDATGYRLFPWSSVEHVMIKEASHSSLAGEPPSG
ncbi:MAG: hypothetical protein K0S10_1320 [Rubrobacteraceae bacterium]|jgi:hypothetical protein|nr:hypothetical protein [Rubrobacteraceae bacterium]